MAKICRQCGKECVDESLTHCPDCGNLLPEGSEPLHSGYFLSLSNSSDQFRPGGFIDGRFKIERELGRGASGRVFLARQQPLDRLVAVKVLKHEHTKNRDAARRFLLEAKAAAALENPHIVKIHDFKSTPEGQYYIAMEYVAGRTLKEALSEDGPLPPSRVVEIGAQICDALTEAHGKGIIHRDLKPGNILIQERPDQSFSVKVVDFGIAKFIQEGSIAASTTIDPIADTPHTIHLEKAQDAPVSQSSVSDSLEESSNPASASTSRFFGTPLYRCPDMALGHPISPSIDLYSLGVVLYELIAGVPPFVSESPQVLLMHHSYKAPPPLKDQENCKDLSPALNAAIMGALSKKPAERPSSAAAFKAELLQALPTRLRRVALWAAVVVAMLAGGLVLWWALTPQQIDHTIRAAPLKGPNVHAAGGVQPTIASDTARRRDVADTMPHTDAAPSPGDATTDLRPGTDLPLRDVQQREETDGIEVALSDTQGTKGAKEMAKAGAVSQVSGRLEPRPFVLIPIFSIPEKADILRGNKKVGETPFDVRFYLLNL